MTTELLSDEINFVVLRTEGRDFPGMVLQGDSLRRLYKRAKAAHDLARSTNANEEVIDEIEDLYEELRERIIFYERVLDEHKIDLPYPRRVSEK